MDPFWGMTCAILVPGILLASWIDYAQRRVPNWLNALLIVCGFVVQGYFHGVAGLGMGLGGLAVGFGVLIVPWLMHAMGAGDVKLMAAIGVWFGPWMTLVSFAVGGVIGGVIAVVMIVSTGRLRNAWGNLGVILIKCSNPKLAFEDFGSAHSFGSTSLLLPYGVPLTIGSLIVLCGQLLNWWVL
ncbi:MAG TPA: A24 family peptidase [Phycisphaerae bacterium]|nr:A24 family peptidase [Phycisphaerae bacterium]